MKLNFWPWAILLSLASQNSHACFAPCSGSRDECNAQMVQGQLPVVTEFLTTNRNYCRDKAPGEYPAPFRGEGVRYSADPVGAVHCSHLSAWLEVEYDTEPRLKLIYPMGQTAINSLPMPLRIFEPEEELPTATVDSDGNKVFYFERRRKPLGGMPLPGPQ